MKEIRDKLSIITEDLTNKALLIILTLGGGSELTDKMVGEEKKSEINR